MTAPSYVMTEEGTDESARPVPEKVCLYLLAEPWLRSHYYRRPEVASLRLTLAAMCAVTGHRACALYIWRAGLPTGADLHAWNGDME